MRECGRELYPTREPPSLETVLKCIARVESGKVRPALVVQSDHNNARLNETIIAAIYDIGEHEEVIFIVMEYVEGELLSAKLERGPLALRESIEIAAQIADALGYTS